ncbi:hypothetical protein X768_16710 [Mesorhizobium sp. LSJC265A00]|uniref:DNA adenine methylase n=1 Tax=Mesorhizobium sp. LSJC265A00 TaxID=1287322 RepID=UPI0003CE1EC7|nr:Dam family site-specific DNA-(adenine-N6)-methyltransferase [Mesorhizobium sp. LSJC265A00]ESX09979.1 hypothetical protein X768_16710 [Mesorhizobium sp. LSJC265A00]
MTSGYRPTTSPILRWAGSKRASVQALTNYWQPGEAYVEPFCGSAALFFCLAPDRAVLTDINADLISFYTECQNNPSRVWQLASDLPVNEETYYLVRGLYNEAPKSSEKASYFLYLNRTCFNGIYRTNREGRFNVPYSGKRLSQFIPKEDFLRRVEAIKRVTFKASDFEETIVEHANENVFFFIDPPYAAATSRSFTEYDSQPFGTKDLSRLVTSLQQADRRGAKFVLTYDRDLLPFDPVEYGWNASTFSVHRNIGGFKASRRVATEIIVSNTKRRDDGLFNYQ